MLTPKVGLTENNEFESNKILQNVTDIYLYFVPLFLCEIYQ